MSAIESIVQVLSEMTLYETPGVFSRYQGLLSSQINYPTVNEDAVIQRIIYEYQQQKAREQSLWRIGGAIAGLCLGLGDGLQFGDFLGAAVGSAMTGGIATQLNQLNDAQLKEYQLEWVNTPESYCYHRKRHRGEAVRRLLMIDRHPQTGRPCTVFGVQFPDGYVAHLGKVEGATTPVFGINGSGFDTDWVMEKQQLGMIPTDIGRNLPVELWSNPRQNQHLVAIPYNAPHQYVY
ncbi:MAG: hypothetical protein VKJ86_11160 [Synechococcus sp.]|nr:hypothetical protein [Synechococcus sp.]